ncbi:Thiol-disulfide oxidoreductase D [Jannaschia seosinensis]|uniref:Thiol-disulfide oxidoreductase D n=1 Tax=Jannaschia seosinensis TaxID=313367 RepID=A0A0M7BAY3_9RHOB|nr:DsbA family protein [Jannaschia seosinensis]CUH38982.1 Thiol-disulfide oxidoreductase D [Jannaschia seosinensis]
MIDRRKALILGGAAILGTGAYGLWNGNSTTSGLVDLGAARAQGTADIAEITLGREDAPVKVVEYASYTCPHCASFHNDTFKDFKREYIDTGKVHFTYREVFFDRYGLWAAMIARCVGPERYFGVADMLYQTQSEWARQGDPAAVAQSLKRIGAQAGLSPEEADACLEDAEKAQALVAWYEAKTAEDGVRSTPSFVIDGNLHSGNMSLAQIGALVDEAAG